MAYSFWILLNHSGSFCIIAFTAFVFETAYKSTWLGLEMLNSYSVCLNQVGLSTIFATSNIFLPHDRCTSMSFLKRNMKMIGSAKLTWQHWFNVTLNTWMITIKICCVLSYQNSPTGSNTKPVQTVFISNTLHVKWEACPFPIWSHL